MPAPATRISLSLCVAAVWKIVFSCSPCPPGERRYLPCGSDSRRICVPCSRGTFSSNYSDSDECEFCQNYCIRVNEIIVANCTSVKDTVCHCKPGTWLRSEEEPVCLHHTQCDKGYGVKNPGTRTSDTVCMECPPGYYSDSLSSTEPCRQLTNCEATGVKVPGDHLSDNVCHVAASKDDVGIMPDYAIILLVVSAIAVAAFVLLVHLVIRRRAATGRSVFTRAKGCLPTQSSKQPGPPAYGQVALNDLDVTVRGTFVLPLLVGDRNIEADDVNQNVMGDVEKLAYKTCVLPEEIRGFEIATVVENIFVELSHRIQTNYIPFFNLLPDGLSEEEMSSVASLSIECDLQGFVLSCFRLWSRKACRAGAHRMVGYLVQTLQHEAIAEGALAIKIQARYHDILGARSECI